MKARLGGDFCSSDVITHKGYYESSYTSASIFYIVKIRFVHTYMYSWTSPSGRLSNTDSFLYTDPILIHLL